MRQHKIQILACCAAACAAALLADVWFGGYKPGLQGITTIPKGPLVLHNYETSAAYRAVAFFSGSGASDVTAVATWTLASSNGMIAWVDGTNRIVRAYVTGELDRAVLSAAYGGYTAVVHMAAFNPAYVTDTDSDNIPDEWEQAYGMSIRDAGDAYQCWSTNANPLAALTNNLWVFVLDGVLSGPPTFPTNFWSTTGWWRDTDGDGIPDGWELEQTNDLTYFTHYTDSDGDGLTDYEEYLLGTNPNSADTDNDGIPDYWDINPVGPNPQPVVVVRYPEPGTEI